MIEKDNREIKSAPAENGYFQLSPRLPEDLARLRDYTESFQKGEMSLERYRSQRVPQGIYEERSENSYMIRIRLPGGGLLPEQMRSVADVSRKYGNALLHVTTRQDIQIHKVKLDNLMTAVMELYQAGLTSRGGGGNGVRNVTGCSQAGVCPDEVFDITAGVVSTTEFLMEQPQSFELPRKYKICFSGCSVDCAGVRVNDLGFVATIKAGKPGYRAYVGGGMGARSRIGDLLEEFIPVNDAPLVGEAVKRVFDRNGNRKNKHRARLRFLIDQLGIEEFKQLYRSELEKLKAEHSLSPRTVNTNFNVKERGDTAIKLESANYSADELKEWRDGSVEAQKQSGYYSVNFDLPLGDISSDRLEKLADIIAVSGEGMLRATPHQNLLLRNVPEDELPALYGYLKAENLVGENSEFIRNSVACAGASTCKLGICLSRGALTAILNNLKAGELDLKQLKAIKLYVSGCPNACSRHPVADLALVGAARRNSDGTAPHYIIQLGGRIGENDTALAAGRYTFPARIIPEVLKEFFKVFISSPEYPDFRAFIKTQGEAVMTELMEKMARLPLLSEDESYFYDWDSDTRFTLAERGAGECGAGVFDLIEVDFKSAEELLEKGEIGPALGAASRALLVTKGFESSQDREGMELFLENFIRKNLVDRKFEELIVSQLEPEKSNVKPTPEAVGLFIATLRDIYSKLDQSLRFPGEK